MAELPRSFGKEAPLNDDPAPLFIGVDGLLVKWAEFGSYSLSLGRPDLNMPDDSKLDDAERLQRLHRMPIRPHILLHG